MDLYQVCSNYAPGAKNGPGGGGGGHVLHRLIWGDMKKILSEITRPKALIFGT